MRSYTVLSTKQQSRPHHLQESGCGPTALSQIEQSLGALACQRKASTPGTGISSAAHALWVTPCASGDGTKNVETTNTAYYFKTHVNAIKYVLILKIQ